MIALSLELLLISLRRRYDTPTAPPIPLQSLSDHPMLHRDRDELFQEIIQYLKRNIFEHLTVVQICKDNSVGRSQLQKLFHEKLGCGVINYFCQLKIETARKLIREKRYNYTQISDILGYSSYQYFSLQFKKFTRMTPSEYASSVKSFQEARRRLPYRNSSKGIKRTGWKPHLAAPSLFFSCFFVFQLFFMLYHQLIDPLNRIQQLADRGIVVQGINEQSNIFAHIAVYIIFFLQKLIRLVHQIGGEQSVEITSREGFVEFFHSICEESEGGAHEDLTCSFVLQKCGNFQHAVAGGDHVINNDHILPATSVPRNSWATIGLRPSMIVE